MRVSVEAVNKIERRLTVTVEPEKVENAYTKQINEIAQKVEIKGFRRGKAPLSQVTKRYGNEARSDALNEVIRSSLYEALQQEKIQPVSQPRIEPKMMAPNQPLEFVAVVEIYPEIEDVQFSLDKLVKPVTPITDEDINRVIEQLREQHAKYKLVDRPAQLTDQVFLDFYPLAEGKPDLQHQQKNFPLILGKKTMIPGFEDGIVGMKAGDEKTLNLTFPENFFVKERAGQNIEFSVKVLQVLEAEMPVVDEAYIKLLGIANGKMEDLVAEIRKNLERERDRVIKVRVRDQVFKKLLEQNPTEIPQSLVQQEARHIHDEMHPYHKGQEDHHHSKEEDEIFFNMANERVTLGILIAAYVKKHQVKVDSARVQTRMKELSEIYENAEEMLRQLESNRQQRAMIESQILEEVVVEKLLEGIPVEEKAVSYQELIAK